uniref:DNA mismatch repair protein MutH n=1 Tax=uncultured marine virus TaxID=186617 RepID=A0A0F7L7A9_9VIRU|nr:DNA mismatch repair protein MutH [uncultured marine virus]
MTTVPPKTGPSGAKRCKTTVSRMLMWWWICSFTSCPRSHQQRCYFLSMTSRS